MRPVEPAISADLSRHVLPGTVLFEAAKVEGIPDTRILLAVVQGPSGTVANYTTVLFFQGRWMLSSWITGAVQAALARLPPPNVDAPQIPIVENISQGLNAHLEIGQALHVKAAKISKTLQEIADKWTTP